MVRVFMRWSGVFQRMDTQKREPRTGTQRELEPACTRVPRV